MSVGLLMILGALIALLQVNFMRQRAEYLFQADQPARTVLRVRSDFLTFQRELRELASKRDAAQFNSESNNLLFAFDSDVGHANQALAALPRSSQRDSELSSLETVRALFAEQIGSLTALAQSGDWLGLNLRIESRMPVINDLSESVVRDIDALVDIEKKSGLEDIRRAQQRAAWTLVVTSLLAVITAGFLGLKVTRSIAGRLEKVDAAARSLAGGQFRHQLVVGGSDEISRLTEVFNEMSARLRGLYETLQQSEARFRSIIEHASDFILILDARGLVRYASPSSERALGQNEPLVSRSIFDLVSSADEVALRNFLERAKKTAESQNSIELRTSLAVTPSRVLQVSATNLLQEPSVAGIVMNAREITEVKRLEEQLRQAQRMEAIGTLSGGVAHDFNNLLTVIRGYTNQLLESPHNPPESRMQIKRIDEAAERASSLTRQLLAFSRRQVLQPKVFDINELVANLDQMLRRLIGEHIEMKTVAAKDSCLVKADAGQIEQVIMNIAINARDAMPQGGRLTLETAHVELETAFAAEAAGATPGPYVMLAVSDTGEGMDAETKAHIFEPFFTTKGLGKGTGLGLSTVYGIVKQSGGYISVYSELRRGSTFKVYLPRALDAVKTRRREEPSKADAGGNETILVVEDEPMIRELIEAMLQNRGYSVLIVDNPMKAAAFAAQHTGPIHLLLTDVVMPGISGREIATQISAERPEMKVIFVSGYTPNAIVHHGILDEDLNFLQKPFTAVTLTNKVREVLNGRV
ncbi:MAG TPA: response regulator [Candidatus Acidoferrum sp.]|nr:response regulator [Candidatus Acidoferrum sp.]